MTQFKPKQQSLASQSRGISIPCPHCGQRARTYGSIVQLSDRVQHRTMRCTNQDCSATYKVQIDIFYEMQPPVNHEPPVETE